jgi:hypothetical protein
MTATTAQLALTFDAPAAAPADPSARIFDLWSAVYDAETPEAAAVAADRLNEETGLCLRITGEGRPQWVPSVGDICSATWGYDQTNVNYFQVVKVSKSGQWVTFQEIGKRRDATAEGATHYATRPSPEVIKGDAFRRKLVTSPRYGAWCKFRDYAGGGVISPWNGRPEMETDPRYGH